MQVRCIDSDWITAHFYHLQSNDSCLVGSKDYERHERHKEYLIKRLKILHPGIVIIDESFERIKDGNAPWRVADLRATLNGQTTVHEIQLSYQTASIIKERNEDYLSKGYKIIWWLGDAFSPTVCEKLTELGVEWGKCKEQPSGAVLFLTKEELDNRRPPRFFSIFDRIRSAPERAKDPLVTAWNEAMGQKIKTRLELTVIKNHIEMKERKQLPLSANLQKSKEILEVIWTP